MSDESLNNTDPNGPQNKEGEAANQTEAEKIAALEKQTEEQEILNSTLTKELETLRAQVTEKQARGVARRKNSHPKNLDFDHQADNPEGEDDDEVETPERDESESESDGSPPPLRKKKQNRGVKGGAQTKPIPINLGDPLPSEVTPEALAKILNQIMLESKATGQETSDVTALAEKVSRLLLETHTENRSSPGIGTARKSQRGTAKSTSRNELAEIRARLEKYDDETKLLRSQIHRALSSAPEIAQICEATEHTPFSPKVMSVRITDPGKLSIQKYDGSTNPKDHINAFRVALSRANFRSTEEKDAGFCLLFAEYLKGPALDWFLNLEPSSVENFQQLTTLFLKQYSMFIEKSASVIDLWNMLQGEGESLRNYMDRFKTTMTKAGAVNDEIAIDSLRKGLRIKSEFRKELAYNKPKSIADAIHRSVVFIEEEEDMKLLAASQLASKATAKQPPNPPVVQLTNQASNQHPNHRRGRNGYIHHEGPNFSGAHNYQVGATQQIPSTSQAGAGRGRGSRNYVWTRNQNPANQEEKPYCEFHQCYGHSTERCRHLGSELAKKLLSGELKGDLKLEDLERPEPRERSEQPDTSGRTADRPKRGRRDDSDGQSGSRQRIYLILGGSQYCPDTVTSIKAFQRRADAAVNWCGPPRIPNVEITFTENEVIGIDKPHDDPLVIMLAVGKYDIARILIDTGSTVDIIYKSTLIKMGIDLNDVKTTPKPLTGFGGETTMSMGSIILPVEAGGITKMVNFSVSDNPPIYNIIMGTPWINSMRAVPSTYHLCLKFPTPKGVKTIFGSQKDSRICFMTEHKLRNPLPELLPEEERKKIKTSRESANGLANLL